MEPMEPTQGIHVRNVLDRIIWGSTMNLRVDVPIGLVPETAPPAVDGLLG